MKKNEEAAAKKKPKTSAAQIRVQKGMRLIRPYQLANLMSFTIRFDRTRPSVHYGHPLPRPRGPPQLHSHHHS